MFEGAAWQLREEGSTVVVMDADASQEEFEQELMAIVSEAGLSVAMFEWDGPLVSIRKFTLWESCLFAAGRVWGALCRWCRGQRG
jgi:mannose/fructose/N-acetylgalactosamine-specific phosphotransferase system component IIB